MSFNKEKNNKVADLTHQAGECGCYKSMRGGTRVRSEQLTLKKHNTNNEFPPAATNPALPQLGIKFLRLTISDLEILTLS